MIIDEYHELDNKKIKKEIDRCAELITDLIHFNHRKLDEYTRYRMLKALETIITHNKKIK